MIVSLATYRLDEDTLRDWRKFDKEDTATWSEIYSFLEAQQRSFDDEFFTEKSTIKSSEAEMRTFQSSPSNTNTDTLSADTKRCSLSKESHFLWAFPKFGQMATTNRLAFGENGLHLKFSQQQISPGEGVLEQTLLSSMPESAPLASSLRQQTNRSNLSAPTDSASQKGNTQLQGLSPEVKPFKPSNLVKQDSSSFGHVVSSLSTFETVTKVQTLLSTVSLQVADNFGQFHLGRALLDSGSDTNFITTDFAKKLNLEFDSHITFLTGISGSKKTVKYRTSSTIRSNYEEYVKQLSFTVLEDITGKLPSQTIDPESFDIPSKYQLADPQFNVSGKVDLLLDSEIFYDCLLSQKIRLNSGPMLLHTKFGWILGGTLSEAIISNVSLLSGFSFKARIAIEPIDSQLEKFFAIENFDDIKALSAEERYCEQLFADTTTRDINGKFIVMLPFQECNKPLGNNLANALRMSFILESRRKKDETLDKLYREYMGNYQSSGHVTEVSPHTVSKSHYLPHHGVVKMTSTSTKLRPVFNASSVSETGISLNDILCTGPTVQPESIDIVMRFRESQFVLMADVEKMYRQVWVHPSQRDYLRFLWRDDDTEPIKHFHHNTVPFGTKSAPFLATRVVKQIAIDNEKAFPEASQIIRRSFYVDDLAFGFNTIEEGIELRDQIRLMMIQAGMKLTKFASNNPLALEGLHADDVQQPNDDNVMIKILGISYDTKADEFSYNLKSLKPGRVTRASVLSDIASIYDPIGWIGPVVLKAKLFMKHIWLTRNKLDWKDFLPQEDEEQWDIFRTTITAVNNVRIPRHCYSLNTKTIELHGFCDASEVAYGAVIYALTTDHADNIQVSILCAKSRVAPKNQKTLARLELCAATLLAKLMKRTTTTLDASINEVTLWSDSTIVLNWIFISVPKLTTFVANRVSVIQDLTHKYQWKHIKGVDNPADVISRGLLPHEIEDHCLWWNGPQFFQHPKAQWPESQIVISEQQPDVVAEMKKSLTAKTSNDLIELIESRFSRYQVLLHTFAYINRFARRVTRSGPLTIEDIEAAEVTVIRIIQQNFFAEEYKELKKNKQQLIDNNDVNIQPHQQKFQPQISRSSSLISLAPYLDEQDLIRVGGRINESPGLSNDQKHQIILPQCRFTATLIRHLHYKHLHPGQQTLLSLVRERYWPIRGKSTIRKITHDCIKCFRVNPSVTRQFMSDLPSARVTMTTPFANTAVDFAGFYTIKTGTTRNAPSTKCYVALFKCMSTGAIHLEVASDLTTQAFIAALSRFVSRRSKPSQIFSDNGTNFEGTDNELKKIIQDMDHDIAQYCAEQSIRWNFTTPRAPHAGGIYESGIKNMKHHLKRVFDKSFNFEQFTTILCKIEAILNSRPITPMSEDPMDLAVLTPGHFLVGHSLVALPESNYLGVQQNRLKLWQQVQQATQQFWHLWYHDYLHNLQKRPVNFRQKYEVKVGDMVLLIDRNLPSMKWLLGRVIQLFPSKRSNIVRNVKVMTQHGPKERDIRYLSFLPFNNLEDDNHN